MHQRALRTVLLIQAIEETDRAGEVIPIADRADASRSALRALSSRARGASSLAATSAPLTASSSPLATTSSPLTATTSPLATSEDFLVRRAELLFTRLATRAPAVVHIIALAGGFTWLSRALLIIAFVAGACMAALDGSRRINVLAFPLVGLIAWNILIYLILCWSWLSVRRAHAVPPRWTGSLYARWIERRITALLKHSMRFNVPLASGLRRFAREWSAIAQPLLVSHAKRLLHLAAALLATGLVAGLYVRGVVLRYEAGWESTFLGPRSVHALLRVLYGPAAALSGLRLPSLEELARLRWTATGGGGEAATWIHLIALTALLYIVLPRLLAAVAATYGIWRFSRRPPIPPTLRGYARALAMSVGQGAVSEVAGVIAYAYEPSRESIAGLELLLTAALGTNLRVQMRQPLRYGEESAFEQHLMGAAATHDDLNSSAGSSAAGESSPPGRMDWTVLLMTLAATPESENHGALIAHTRDWLIRNARTAPFLVVIDETPYAARMRAEAGLEQRLEERRRLWSEFVAAYGLRAGIVNLTQITPGTAAESGAKEAIRAALWTASEHT